MQNAKLIFSPTLSKSSMIEEILCDARLRLSREHRLLADFAETKQSKALVEGLRRQKRSIVDLCEHFGVRCTRAKFTNQNDFSGLQANFHPLHIRR